MEVTGKNGGCKPARNNAHRVVIALVFIAVGLLLFGRNLNIVDGDLIRVVVSWQMLLIVIGLSMLLIRRAVVPGAILIGIGGFFMIPLFVGYREMETYWPLVFVFVGVVILVSRLGAGCCRRRYDDK